MDTLERIPVIVQHRIDHAVGQRAVRVGSLIYSDIIYHRHNGPRRLFWLLDHGVQLIYEPFGWVNAWYVDLVAITRSTQQGQEWYQVRDMDIDIVVEGMGPTYRLVDLEEFGSSLVAGELTLAEAQDVLTRTQIFLDAFLHRGAPWPPPIIRPFFAADHCYPAFESASQPATVQS